MALGTQLEFTRLRVRTGEKVTSSTTTTRQRQHISNIQYSRRTQVIHSIPEVQLVIHTINIPRTLPRIRLQQLPNLRQVLCRQLHVSSIQIFQSALYVSTACSARVNQQRTTRRSKKRREWGGRILYSRRSGKRDDVVAKSTNPSDAQLGDCDAFTIRYGRQSFHELKVVINILRSWSNPVSA
jgi:hypothetical protein